LDPRPILRVDPEEQFTAEEMQSMEAFFGTRLEQLERKVESQTETIIDQNKKIADLEADRERREAHEKSPGAKLHRVAGKYHVLHFLLSGYHAIFGVPGCPHQGHPPSIETVAAVTAAKAATSAALPRYPIGNIATEVIIYLPTEVNH
jgi:uncharacterized coiled-coil protein SlyX